MLRARPTLARIKLSQPRRFCTNTNKPTNNNNNGEKVESNLSKYNEAYRQLDNLDFMTATKILFSDPPKKKKFGIDFHLVQLFFACMPSLAVYLVAQYARSEMRKMDEELEKRKKKEEEERAKEEELKAMEERAQKEAALSEVKDRLDKLEKTIKEIVVESKKKRGGSVKEDQEGKGETRHLSPTEPDNVHSQSEATQSLDKDVHSKQKSAESASSPDASQQDQKGKTENGGTSAKR